MLFWLRLLGRKYLTIDSSFLAKLFSWFSLFLLLLFLCGLVLLLLIDEIVFDVGIGGFTVHSKLVNINVGFEITISINGEAANDFFGKHIKNEDYAILATYGRQSSLRIKFND